MTDRFLFPSLHASMKSACLIASLIVLLLFSAILAWQLGALPATTLATLRVILWSFAACYVVIALLTWRYFFVAPLAFAVLVAIALALAVWRGSAGAT